MASKRIGNGKHGSALGKKMKPLRYLQQDWIGILSLKVPRKREKFSMSTLYMAPMAEASNVTELRS